MNAGGLVMASLQHCGWTTWEHWHTTFLIWVSCAADLSFLGYSKFFELRAGLDTSRPIVRLRKRDQPLKFLFCLAHSLLGCKWANQYCLLANETMASKYVAQASYLKDSAEPPLWSSFSTSFLPSTAGLECLRISMTVFVKSYTLDQLLQRVACAYLPR